VIEAQQLQRILPLLDRGELSQKQQADLFGALVQEINKKCALDGLFWAKFVSTRDEADLSSGRGVGMAAVQGTISELGGTMSLTTTPLRRRNRCARGSRSVESSRPRRLSPGISRT